MDLRKLRQSLITRRVYGWAAAALPSMSATEEEALNAGDVWWDAALFSGNPDWTELLEISPPHLSDAEMAYLQGPVDELCAMLDAWQINWDLADLPPEVWRFIKENRFFGMIIPEEYGGLAFSAAAQSEIVRKICTRSAVAAVTVMVPNSLGPGELLLQFGTEEQRNYWLPRLADGREVPCFGLTSPEAGSDAAAMTDTGVVCRGSFRGKDTIGIRLNWHKRYITLGPVATVMGLAFKLYDPDRLLGGEENLGITVALVPTDLDGIEIGRRHLPSYQMFQNGPNMGKDVFVPLEFVLGGSENVGKGWQMLMSALAAGRGISLPSISAAGAAFSAWSTGSYARVRQQFDRPIGKFEGVQARLGVLAARAYLLDAARRLTCAGVDAGYKPAIVSAIMKSHCTYRLREAVDHAMDVHGGKAVIDGPLNYLGDLNRSVPIAITVEGANIVTRNLIIFGQGAIRCHPWLLKELKALSQEDRARGLGEFDRAFWGHVSHSVVTLGRAWVRAWTGGALSPAPAEPATRPYFKKLGRYAAAFALTADATVLMLGGALKREEMLSARLGDVLAELYLLSAVLKRWRDDGSEETDLPLVAYCMEEGFETIERRLHEVYRHFPNKPMAAFLRRVTFPLGPGAKGPSDALIKECAEILLEPNAARNRLCQGLYLGKDDDDNGVARLARAYDLVIEAAEPEKRLRDSGVSDLDDEQAQSLLTAEEASLVRRARQAVAQAIAVDDFPASAFARAGATERDSRHEDGCAEKDEGSEFKRARGSG